MPNWEWRHLIDPSWSRTWLQLFHFSPFSLWNLALVNLVKCIKPAWPPCLLNCQSSLKVEHSNTKSQQLTSWLQCYYWIKLRCQEVEQLHLPRLSNLTCLSDLDYYLNLQQNVQTHRSLHHDCQIFHRIRTRGLSLSPIPALNWVFIFFCIIQLTNKQTNTLRKT